MNDLASETALRETSRIQRDWDRRQDERWGGRVAHYRSRARVCWQQARQLRRYVDEHGWHLSADDIDLSLEHAADLRKEAAENIRTAKRIQRGLF